MSMIQLTPFQQKMYDAILEEARAGRTLFVKAGIRSGITTVQEKLLQDHPSLFRRRSFPPPVPIDVVEELVAYDEDLRREVAAFAEAKDARAWEDLSAGTP